MPRLKWTERQCTNPPEGWRIGIVKANFDMGFLFQASQDTGMAQHIGCIGPTEAEAKRGCEAALLRLGVLEPGGQFVSAARLILDFGGRANDRAVAAIAAALAALEVEASDV